METDNDKQATVESVKAEVFDIIRQMEILSNQYRQLNALREEKIKLLADLEAKAKTE